MTKSYLTIPYWVDPSGQVKILFNKDLETPNLDLDFLSAQFLNLIKLPSSWDSDSITSPHYRTIIGSRYVTYIYMGSIISQATQFLASLQGFKHYLDQCSQIMGDCLKYPVIDHSKSQLINFPDFLKSQDSVWVKAEDQDILRAYSTRWNIDLTKLKQVNDELYIADLKKKHYAYIDNLKPEYRQALNYYTANGFEEMNNWLRGKTKVPSIGEAQMLTYVNMMNQILVNAPVIDQPIMIYRGLKFDEQKAFHDIPEGSIIDLFRDSFNSCSFSLGISSGTTFAGYQCCTYLFHLPARVMGLYVGTRSSNPNEDEFILAPGPFFRAFKWPGDVSFPLKNLYYSQPSLRFYRLAGVDCDSAYERYRYIAYHQLVGRGVAIGQFPNPIKSMPPGFVDNANQIKTPEVEKLNQTPYNINYERPRLRPFSIYVDHAPVLNTIDLTLITKPSSGSSYSPVCSIPILGLDCKYYQHLSSEAMKLLSQKKFVGNQMYIYNSYYDVESKTVQDFIRQLDQQYPKLKPKTYVHIKTIDCKFYQHLSPLATQELAKVASAYNHNYIILHGLNYQIESPVAQTYLRDLAQKYPKPVKNPLKNLDHKYYQNLNQEGLAELKKVISKSAKNILQLYGTVYNITSPQAQNFLTELKIKYPKNPTKTTSPKTIGTPKSYTIIPKISNLDEKYYKYLSPQAILELNKYISTSHMNTLFIEHNYYAIYEPQAQKLIAELVQKYPKNPIKASSPKVVSEFPKMSKVELDDKFKIPNIDDEYLLNLSPEVINKLKELAVGCEKNKFKSPKTGKCISISSTTGKLVLQELQDSVKDKKSASEPTVSEKNPLFPKIENIDEVYYKHLSPEAIQELSKDAPPPFKNNIKVNGLWYNITEPKAVNYIASLNKKYPNISDIKKIKGIDEKYYQHLSPPAIQELSQNIHPKNHNYIKVNGLYYDVNHPKSVAYLKALEYKYSKSSVNPETSKVDPTLPIMLPLEDGDKLSFEDKNKPSISIPNIDPKYLFGLSDKVLKRLAELTIGCDKNKFKSLKTGKCIAIDSKTGEKALKEMEILLNPPEFLLPGETFPVDPSIPELDLKTIEPPLNIVIQPSSEVVPQSSSEVAPQPKIPQIPNIDAKHLVGLSVPVLLKLQELAIGCDKNKFKSLKTGKCIAITSSTGAKALQDIKDSLHTKTDNLEPPLLLTPSPVETTEIKVSSQAPIPSIPHLTSLSEVHPMVSEFPKIPHLPTIDAKYLVGLSLPVLTKLEELVVGCDPNKFKSLKTGKCVAISSKTGKLALKEIEESLKNIPSEKLSESQGSPEKLSESQGSPEKLSESQGSSKNLSESQGSSEKLSESPNKHTLDNGTYVGDMVVNGVPHGQGLMMYTSGSVYKGQFDYGLPSGFGQLTLPNGLELSGQFMSPYVADVKITYPDATYKGPVSLNIYHDPNYDEYDYKVLQIQNFGQIAYQGMIYKGPVSGDEKSVHILDGTGQLLFENGDIYDGQFKNEKMHGKGIYTQGQHTFKVKYLGGELQSKIPMLPTSPKPVLSPSSTPATKVGNPMNVCGIPHQDQIITKPVYPKPTKPKVEVKKIPCKSHQKPASGNYICNPLTGNWIGVGKDAYNKLLKTFTAEDLLAFTASLK